jgi:hypothetical protein
MSSNPTDVQRSSAVQAIAGETGHEYWACNNQTHRHLLQSTANACIRSEERNVHRGRKWDEHQLDVLLQSRLAGVSEEELAARHQIAPASLRALLRHADGLRLRFSRRKGRWDGKMDPWTWLSANTHCELRALGLETIDDVRGALVAGALRNKGYKGIAGKQMSAEVWRWLRWVGSEPSISSSNEVLKVG